MTPSVPSATRVPAPIEAGAEDDRTTDTAPLRRSKRRTGAFHDTATPAPLEASVRPSTGGYSPASVSWTISSNRNSLASSVTLSPIFTAPEAPLLARKTDIPTSRPARATSSSAGR